MTPHRHGRVVVCARSRISESCLGEVWSQGQRNASSVPMWMFADMLGPRHCAARAPASHPGGRARRRGRVGARARRPVQGRPGQGGRRGPQRGPRACAPGAAAGLRGARAAPRGGPAARAALRADARRAPARAVRPRRAQRLLWPGEARWGCRLAGRPACALRLPARSGASGLPASDMEATRHRSVAGRCRGVCAVGPPSGPPSGARDATQA
jgi:hypothetical protein